MLPQIPILEPPQTHTPLIIRIINKEEPKKPPIIYKVKRGDKLTKIAKAFNVSWKRIYYANKGIQHPDRIKAGMTLIIPQKDEKLKVRKIPGIIRPSYSASVSSPRIRSGASSSGNTYTPGFCTWHVKNLAVWVPNGWGDASNWLYRARSDGYSTGSTPRVGAVGWTPGHVVYVVAVKGDTVTISEMNYDYIQYHQRTVDFPASKYTYIYP